MPADLTPRPKPRKGRRTRRANNAGQVRQLPSGRWQARFPGPDGVTRTAPETYDTKQDAVRWLEGQAADVARGLWAPPEPVRRGAGLTLAEYADAYVAQLDVKPRTRRDYEDTLRLHVRDSIGTAQVDRITTTMVRAWHAATAPGAPSARSHAYALLRAVLAQAVEDGLLAANPARVRGAGTARRRSTTRVASLPEIEAITQAMPERYRPMVQLAAWCGLRFGELTELRRGDVDVEAGTVTVNRGVVRVAGEFVVGTPKSAAGVRTVTMPPHIVGMVEAHLGRHVGPDPGALLFPARGGGHMAPSTLYKVFYPAREAAGRPDLRWHDLRHTGATLAAAAGATLGDLQARLGHSTVAAALRYQHSVGEDRDRALAAALSEFAGATVVPLRPRRSAG